MNKKWVALLASTAVLTLAACSNDTIATTNKGNITKDELYQALKQSAGSKVLYSLIVEKIAVASVTDKEAIDKEVNEFIALRKASAGGEEAFLKSLKQYGYETEIAFRNAVYANRALIKAIESRTNITDEDVKAAYETWEPSIKASHILVADEALANDIIQQIKNGGDWNALAAQHSTDTSNKENGGSLGTFKRTAMVAEFAAALAEMKTGDISQTPVKTQFGYHIIKVEDKPEKGTLEAEKETIKKELITAKASNSTYQQTIVQEMLKEANVIITDESLKEAMATLLPSNSSTESSQQNSTTTVQPSSSSETTTTQSSSN
ncbi:MULTISPECIES: peptidylprolyl isomerase [unclassified Granulicatella]|uniref:peptidylprolyl isomerase n=1 Tax=unclassified Granulicatella TaxID=2630493 RepID=UPI00107308F4|nr:MULTISPECIES: peptidylprolyl isomerase [unclassified Granulicatella]MBF0780850.1 peptidylprolyl isomerase [Granulicatella sp. 19428wC4_WM01]TFU93517.1 peptidylprolyl isomerase PrsA [Granulicatella sp. WM01]